MKSFSDTKNILTVFFCLLIYNVDAQCRLTFATSNKTKGDIGLEGADEFCRLHALASNIPTIVSAANEFRAWLSNDTIDAGWRVGGVEGDCFENSASDSVATSLSMFLSSNHINFAFRYDENGTDMGTYKYAWTGTFPSGVAAQANCDNFQSVSSRARGMYGRMDITTKDWSSKGFSQCSQLSHIYCVQSPAAPAAAAEGYLYPLMQPCEAFAFVTEETYTGVTLQNTVFADFLCQEEAKSSAYVIGDEWQSFKAMYATQQRTAADVVGPVRCIGSLNGRPYWKGNRLRWKCIGIGYLLGACACPVVPSSSLRDMISGAFDFIQTPLMSVQAKVPELVWLWLGGPLSLHLQGSTCSGWTSQGGIAHTLKSDGLLDTRICGGANRLLCVKSPAFSGPPLDSYFATNRLMFMSSTEHTGNLGGLAAADAHCVHLANQSSLVAVRERSDRFIAYLSTERQDLLARLYDLDGQQLPYPYVSTSGAFVFSGGYADIQSTSLAESSFFRDEHGEAIMGRLEHPDHRFITGTGHGGVFIGTDCNSWTLSGNDDVLYGINDMSLSYGFLRCSLKYHLLCIEAATPVTTDHYAKILRLPTPFPCLYIFRTSVKVPVLFNSLEVADAICQERASLSSISSVAFQAANFIAVVSNSSWDFLERYAPDVAGGGICHKNTHERLVTSGSFALLIDGQYRASFLPDEFGATGDIGYVYTGTNSDGTVGANCNDWSGSGSSTVTHGLNLGMSGFSYAECLGNQHIVCVQRGYTPIPTAAPSEAPTRAPTHAPVITPMPTAAPSSLPTEQPTRMPTNMPSTAPSLSPSVQPTQQPTEAPIIPVPTASPTLLPTDMPTVEPTRSPGLVPTGQPTMSPLEIGAPTRAPVVGTVTGTTPTVTNDDVSSTTLSTTQSQEISEDLLDDTTTEESSMNSLVPVIVVLATLLCLISAAVVIVVVYRRQRQRKPARQSGGGVRVEGDARLQERSRKRRSVMARTPPRSPRSTSPRKHRRRSKMVGLDLAAPTLDAPIDMSSAASTASEATEIKRSPNAQYDQLPRGVFLGGDGAKVAPLYTYAEPTPTGRPDAQYMDMSIANSDTSQYQNALLAADGASSAGTPASYAQMPAFSDSSSVAYANIAETGRHADIYTKPEPRKPADLYARGDLEALEKKKEEVYVSGDLEIVRGSFSGNETQE